MPCISRRCANRFLVAIALGATLSAAHAVEPVRRDDLGISIQTLVMIIGMSMFGGLISWFSKVRTGIVTGWSLTHLIGELCTSSFAGFMCFLLCDTFSVNIKLTIGLVGIAGHMGTRAINSFERFAEKKWGALVGITPDSKL